MNKSLLFITTIITLAITQKTISQTLYVPSGTGGIAQSLNSSIGVGTSNPQAKLHINIANQDNLGLIIHSNSINTDGIRHYVGLAFDGDYGNGTGNSSQIRSYSNLYSNWGSYLTFHTTDCRAANNLVERMRVDQYGNIGIGTNSPGVRLDVLCPPTENGNDIIANFTRQASSTGGSGIVRFGIHSTCDLEINSGYSSNGFRYGSYGDFNIVNNNPGGSYGGINLVTNGKARLVVWPNGNIGIGTSSPGNYSLNVDGCIRAKEIVVNTTGADFVFEPTYKLRTLAELETFIRTNKHLPDIAPAREMQENGVNTGEMQTKLLQKVEELTLYVIELKKENERLETEKNKSKEEFSQLRNEVKVLKDLINKTSL